MYRKGLLGEFMGNILKLIIIVVIICFTISVISSCDTNAAQNNKPHVVKTKWFKPPKRVKNERNFVPWHNPTNAQMRKINKWEMEKWGNPSLLGLAWCESGYRAKVSAGTYGGYFQYNLGYWPGIWDQIPKKVRVVIKRVVEKPIVRFRKWSHVGWVRKEMNTLLQHRYLVLSGRLPKNASPMHGWAAWRATAYVWSGRGPSVSWECGL